MKELIIGLMMLAAFGFVGEMDYQDACREDPKCNQVVTK